jgi:para-nitrobenzyl esterase
MQGAVFAPGVSADGRQDEDCLYLNVFTPAADGAKRPVLFWIHGGAFTVGSASSPLYDGGPLTELANVVVVTINYRLGALGYLPFGEAGERWGAVDNRGQLDQLAALRWVQANIERFGGDPGNVTLFGESAGGTAVSILLATPSARGLFARAIVQSGTGPLQLPTADRADAARAALLAACGLALDRPESLLDVPTDVLMKAQAKVEAVTKGWPHFYPVMDGKLLPDQPATLLASGQGSTVPLILGTNRDEWNLFALMSLAEWNVPLDDKEAVAMLERKLPASAAGAGGVLFEAYRKSRRERGLSHGSRALLRAIEGDLHFRMPTLRFTEHYLTLQPATYLYLFTHESPALGGALAACHALELPFVFGTYEAPNQASFAGQGEGVAALSRTMMESWSSFASAGAPKARAYEKWSPYDLETRATFEFGADPRLVDDAFGDERRAWDGIF